MGQFYVGCQIGREPTEDHFINESIAVGDSLRDSWLRLSSGSEAFKAYFCTLRKSSATNLLKFEECPKSTQRCYYPSRYASWILETVSFIYFFPSLSLSSFIPSSLSVSFSPSFSTPTSHRVMRALWSLDLL